MPHLRILGEYNEISVSMSVTSGAAVLLVTAIHAVGVSIAAPSQRDAVTALAMELIVVTAWFAFFLQRGREGIRETKSVRARRLGGSGHWAAPGWLCKA